MSLNPARLQHEFAQWLGPLYVLGAAVGFASKAILCKLIYPYGVDPITVLALRMLLSLPFFLLLVWPPRKAQKDGSVKPLGTRGWLTVVGLGLLGYYLCSVLDFYGLLYISAGLDRLILYLYPTMVLAISAVMLRKPISRGEWAALLLSYVGIALAFLHDLRLGPREQVVLGGSLVFGAAMAYAGYILGSGRYIRLLGVSRYTGIAMTAATVGVLAHFAWVRPWTDLVQPRHVMLLLALMALLGTVMPSVFLNEGLRRIGPNSTALLSTIGPVVTLGLSHAFLGEVLSPQKLVGAALVIIGVTLVAVQDHRLR